MNGTPHHVCAIRGLEPRDMAARYTFRYWGEELPMLAICYEEILSVCLLQSI